MTTTKTAGQVKSRRAENIVCPRCERPMWFKPGALPYCLACGRLTLALGKRTRQPIPYTLAR